MLGDKYQARYLIVIQNITMEKEPKQKRILPPDDSPEAADLINRAQSGDMDALLQFMLAGEGEAVFVSDMPGQLVKFEKKKKKKR